MSAINATTAMTTSSVFAEVELLSAALALFHSAQTELLLFVAAIFAYYVLFMQKNPKPIAKKMKVDDDKFMEDNYPVKSRSNDNDIALDSERGAKVEGTLMTAFEAGDYKVVLRCWSAMMKSETMPNVSLAHVVESMQRFKKDTSFILRELKSFFKKFPDGCGITCMNDLLESLAKRLDSDLMEKILEMLPSLKLEMDQRTYEIFLNMYFTTRSFKEVKDLVSQMKEQQVAFTTRSAMVVMKTALKTDNFAEALVCFHELRSTWSSDSLSSTASTAPSHIVSQLVEVACKEHKLSELLMVLHGMPIAEEVVHVMLLECVRMKDILLTQQVEKLAREQNVQFTDVTYGLLIKSMGTDSIRVQALLDEVVEKGIEVTPDFASSVLAHCAQTSNVSMAEKLYKHMQPMQMPVLSNFIRFFADSEQHEKACDVYENDLLRIHSMSEDRVSINLDARMERSLMNAALKCGRSHLAQNLLSSSPSDIAKHLTMIRNFASQGNLKSAFSVFKTLEQSGVDLNSIIYNTVLDACVECRDLQAAEKWMEETKKVSMADVVSFNILIKAHLHNRNFGRARSLLEEIKKEGLQPNRVTFNELINYLVGGKGGDEQRKHVWDIVQEMTAAGVPPNQVTVSILLKSLNSWSSQTDISKTMELINTMDEPMDEVLLSSMVEACVRIGKLDLLESKLKEFQGTSAVAINGSHTYGSLIKAYGHARDAAGVWRCWKEMRSRHIKPSCITVGCMVEAIVSNGDTEGAFELIHQIQADEQCSGALNSVIYCSVLKGFTREKNINRIWEVYEEMSKRNIDLSVITYNTLIDACARCGRMENLPKILEDMKTNHIKPNLVTYSTMLKGHCQNGDVQTGFAILEQMKKDAKLKPDEIMYNSLLDGYAQGGLVDEGLRLVEEMQAEGIPPSNFTLSILVKLMNRARRLDQAFSVVEDLTKKYNIKANVHVYTNLVQACVANQQLSRGMSTLEQMIQERIVPDNRTYAILVRGCMTKNLFDKVDGLMRGALGLPNALPFLQKSVAVCPNLDQALVNEALVGLADRGHAEDLAAPLLSAIRTDKQTSWVRIERLTQQRIASPCLNSVASAPTNRGKGNGKGNNKGKTR